MLKIFILSTVLLVGCSTPTTRFVYSDGNGASVTVEMSKEVNATNLEVQIDAKTGIAKIKADSIETSGREIIRAQGWRESGNLNEVSKIIGDAAKGAAEGAVKGVVPRP